MGNRCRRFDSLYSRETGFKGCLSDRSPAETRFGCGGRRKRGYAELRESPCRAGVKLEVVVSQIEGQRTVHDTQKGRGLTSSRAWQIVTAHHCVGFTELLPMDLLEFCLPLPLSSSPSSTSRLSKDRESNPAGGAGCSQRTKCKRGNYCQRIRM
jgi:hypothetical protein